MPRRVLLTGGSGTIGSALLPRLLRESLTSVVLLLRARDEAHLQERWQGLIAVCELTPQQVARVLVVRGDVSAPEFDLEPAVREQVVATTTHIVHAAGNVRLNQPLELARHDCLESVRSLIRIARACQRQGRLQHLDYCSTIGVAGCLPGVVPEQRHLRPAAYHNTYERAKAEAEDLLWQACAAGLPLTVHRPSMVVGDSRSGRIQQFQVFYYLLGYLSGQRSWGIVPTGGGCSLDIIPVDYVAEALRLSSLRDDSVGRVFHLCSGPQLALDIDDLVPHLREILRARGEALPALRRARPRAIRALLERTLPHLEPALSRSLGSLRFLLDYCQTPQRFATSDSTAYFAAAGLPLPHPARYLETIIDYFRRQRPTVGEMRPSPAAAGSR